MTAPEELEITGVQAHITHVKIVETSRKISSNQMGRLPVTSIRGYKYIMALHNCDSNAILAYPLK